jgi:hypothetical protein
MPKTSTWPLLLLVSLRLHAQNFGEITGTISDSSGAVVTRATVTATNSSTNQKRTVTANETGNYSLPFLSPGSYDVRAESAGFKVATRSGLTLQIGATARIDFNLEVGEVSQQIEVSGGAPLLATETTALGTVIENRRIVELPLNGRNYLQLVTLSPNVTTEGGAGGAGGLQGGTRTQTSLSVAGQRLEFNRYTLDGVENTDPNFNSYIILPSVDALQEFKVQTGIYSAEFGVGSSQINVTTKAGGNQFHGALFEFFRNSSLDAREWLQSTGNKNPFRRNQYGFTISGPIVIPKIFHGKDKLFFMSNFEQLKDRTTTLVNATNATVAMRNGDFSDQRAIFDPLSRTYNASGIAQTATAFPGNIVPRPRLNAVSISMLEFYPEPNVAGAGLSRNFVRNAQSPTDTSQFNQRIDWIDSTKSSWFGRFSWGDELQIPTATFLTDSLQVATRVRQAMISNTRILTATTVNEARFAFNQFNNDLVSYFANKRDVQADLKIPGLFSPSPLAYGVPQATLGGGLNSFGGVTPWISRNSTFQFTDNLSIIHGRHSIKMGGEVRRDRYNQYGNQKVTGEFGFDGQSTFDPARRSTTGYIFADYMLGSLNLAARVTAMANGMLRRSSYYGFIQDDWKITPKITINMGLRYENSRVWHDKYRGIMNVQLFDLGVDSNGLKPGTKVPMLTRPGDGDFYEGLNFHFADGQMTQSGDQHMGRGLVNNDNNNFAPRLGISYSPTARWTLRAGGGIFYVQDIGNPTFDMSRNLAGRDLYIPSIEVRTASMSDPWAEERASASCTGWSGPCLVAPQYLAVVQNNRTPYVTQWLFNIQHEITKNLVLETGYQGNQGHKLLRFVFYNQPIVKSGPTDTRTVAQRQPWPTYGRIMDETGADNSNYHAASAKLTQRFSKGLTYLVAFTWSKSIDLGSAARTNAGDNLQPVNSYDLRAERGLSQFNVGRRFVASAMYELPFGAGKPFANQGVASKIAGGWQVGGIFTFADGAPTSIAMIADTASLNANGNRPDATGISPFPAHPTPQKFWDVAAFNASSPDLNWRPGNVSRETLRRPGTRLADLSLARNIRIHENHSLSVRFEAFNSTNHPNWNTPSTDPRSAAVFGVITSARPMRQLQFGLKYLF